MIDPTAAADGVTGLFPNGAEPEIGRLAAAGSAAGRRCGRTFAGLADAALRVGAVLPGPPDRVPDPRTEAFVDTPEGLASPEREPADPVVSAKAIGIAATAEPTPRATANAPTRPTYRVTPAFGGSVDITARRTYSMARTRPRASRRWRPAGAVRPSPKSAESVPADNMPSP